MPRQARIVIPNTPHHITQRGNYQQKIFNYKYHYMQYCEWINDYALKYNLNIFAYCLMNNHVHFVVAPMEKADLAEVFKTVHMRYANYINKQKQVKGHLWQGRFYSCVLDDAHLYRAIRYVENNPVREKKVKNAWEYKWSSAPDHAGNRKKAPIKLTNYEAVKPEEWKSYLKENDPEMVNEIRLKTKRGLVIGADKFIKSLEKKLNRSLKCLGQGRPKKK